MNIDLDRFAHIDSPLRRWDARWKLAAGAILVVCTVCLRTMPMALAALLLALSLGAAGRLPLREAAARVKAPALVITAIMLILALTAPGDRVHLLGIPLSRAGLAAATLVGAKAFAVVVGLMALVSSSPTQRLWAAMRRLHVPAGLVQVFHLAYRYVFVIQSESRAVHNAMQARAFRRNVSTRSLAVLGNAIGMLLIRSTERAERVYLAMQARGFDGTFPVTEAWSTRTSDIVKAAVVVALSLALLAGDLATAG